MTAPPVVNPYAGRFIPLPKRREKCPITHLCRQSLYNLAAKGELRLVKLGGSVRLDAEHAFNWMATRPALTVVRNLPPAKSATPDRPQGTPRAA